MKSLSKVFALVTLFVAVATSVSAQTDGSVGIGTRTPNSSSILDVFATDKGVLLPRVALTGLTDVTTINPPVESMIVYNTATATGIVPGYYYWSTGDSKWRRLIVDADVANGLTVTNGKITLGGKLNANTEIDVDGKTLSIKGLGTGTTSDNIVVSDATGTLKKIVQSNALSNTSGSLVSTVNGVAAAGVPVLISGDNGLTVTNGNVSLGGALGAATTITADATKTLTIAGLESTGVVADNVVLGDATTGTLKQKSFSDLLASGTSVSNTVGSGKLSTTVNGKTGADVAIDNALSSTVNTLSSTVAGGAAQTTAIINTNALSNTSGSLVSTVNGVAAAGVPVLISGNNGLTTVDGNVSLGGALSAATTITADATKTLTIAGLQSTGVVADNVVLGDATTGTLKQKSFSDLLASGTSVSNTVGSGKLSTTVNGKTGADVAIDNALSSTVNTLSSTVAGGAAQTTSIINTNALSNTSGSLVSTVNGVAAAGVPVLISGNSGLTVTHGNVSLGGALSAATTITADATKTLTIAGLESTGVVADNVVLGDATTGTLKQKSFSDLLASGTSVSNTVGSGKLSTTVNGKTGADVAIDNALSSTVNTLSSTVAGGAAQTTSIINTNALSNTSGSLVSTVNGVAAASVPVLISGNSGLTVTDGNVSLGGALGAATTITADATKTLTIAGLESTGVVADNVVLGDATTGALKQKSFSDLLASGTSVSNTVGSGKLSTTVNGKTGADVAIDNALSSAVNTLSSTVAGGAAQTTSIINTNALSNTSGSLVSTVNGVAAAGVPVLISGNSGLTVTNGNVSLGGALSAATTITADATKTLTIAGLQSGATTDEIVVSSTGVLKKIDPMNLPVSSATQTALNLKENTANKSTAAALGNSDVLFPTQNAVKTYVDAATVDATTLVKGKVQLAGDLAGTAALPRIANGAVTASKVEGLTSGQIIVGVDGTAANNAKVTMNGDVTMSNAGVTAIGTGKVTSSQILDATIATADLAAGAVTASKVEGLASGQIIVGVDGTAANNAKVTMNGDVTMSNAGVTAIGSGKVTSTQIFDGTIVDADVSSSAAIAGSKITPTFTSNVTTTGTATVSGATLNLGTAATANAGKIVLEDGNIGTYNVSLSAPALVAGSNKTITLPDATGTIALTNATVTGDVSGTLTSTSVDKLKGTSMSIGTLNNNDLLKYNGSNWVNAAVSTLGTITLATGTSGTDLNVSGSPANLGGTLTLNVPDASASARGLVTTAAQTIAGAKTFNADITTTGDVAVNGGDVTTTATTATVFNTNATTLNVGGAATTLNLGAALGGITTVNSHLTVAANKNFAQSGTGTFFTGTGGVFLNGITTVSNAVLKIGTPSTGSYGTIVLENGSSSAYNITLKAPSTALTASRTITLPDATGTIALAGKIPVAIPVGTSAKLDNSVVNGGSTNSSYTFTITGVTGLLSTDVVTANYYGPDYTSGSGKWLDPGKNDGVVILSAVATANGSVTVTLANCVAGTIPAIDNLNLLIGFTH